MDTFKIAQSCDVQKTQNNISDVARRHYFQDFNFINSIKKNRNFIRQKKLDGI